MRPLTLRPTTAALLVGFCALGPRGAAAQTPHGWDAFKDTFRAYVAADAVVGAAALVMRDGRVLDRLELGMADRAAGVPVDSATLFHWGSITKTLTAIAVMQLRDRGLLTLDDPVVDYVPELRRVHDPYRALEGITIRMLLSHTAGFMNPTWPYDEGHAWEPFEPTEWAQLVAMMPYQRLHFPPGSRYGYSNPAFIYLARIVEQLSGDSWESYVHKNIFGPLGLTRSYFRATPYHLAVDRSHNYHVRRDSLGAPVVIDNGADFDPGITTPNGGWNAPLGDLATYAAFLTGAAPNDTILPSAALQEMWRPVAPMTAGYQAGAGQWMGLSFFILGEGEDRVLGHTGSQAGFRVFLFFNPRTRTAVIVAYNTANTLASGEGAARVQRAAVEMLREGGRDAAGGR
ncbi:MAG: serine hydrolase domain-containing protein [Gemmatimonadota bacterium]